MKITVIGQGNVGTHLLIALCGAASELVGVSARELLADPTVLPLDSDLYIIAVHDDAIESVAASLPRLEGVVAHTSGSVDINSLAEHERRGVFYPLQSFTKGVNLDYSEIPFFLEASDPESLAVLRRGAALISPHIHEADSQRRKRLHVASVFACNYVNYLWEIADNILQTDGMDLTLLHPLLKATVEKAAHVSPHEGQTGPARRGDTNVLHSHLEFLQDSGYEDLYRTLANGILSSHSYKERL